MKKIRFWDETPEKQSSKRLAFLVIVLFAIIFTGAYLIKTWDFAGSIAIFGGMMTPAFSLVGIGKKQENDRAKIDKP